MSNLSPVLCVAVSQTFGGNALLFYWIMLGNSALAGTWMLHLAKFLWETVFERLIFHNQAEPARVRSSAQTHRTQKLCSPHARHACGTHRLGVPDQANTLKQTACWHSSLRLYALGSK